MHDTHHLELTLTGAPIVLDRVVSLCRARRCTIVALHFEAGDRHRPGRASVTVRAPARMVRLAAERLAGLPDVLSVEYVSDRRVAVRVERGRGDGRQCGSSPVAAGGRDSSASDVIASRPRAAVSRTSVASSWERA
jgi:acetolactate synthase regulatory subunit